MPYAWINAQARVVARIATHTMGDYGGDGGSTWSPAVQVTDVGGGRMVFIVPKASEISGSAAMLGGFDIYEAETAHPESHNPTIANREVLLSGGVPALYDARKLSEYMFHYYPRWRAGSLGSSGSLTTGATYQWQFVYEWRDARGIVHRSAPSAVMEQTLTGGNDDYSYTVASLSLTEKFDVESQGWPVYIVSYRTKANGSTFYREFTLETESSLITAWHSFTSSAADSSLDGREILYTDGGVLPNMQPPAARHIVQHGRRLWLISRDDPTLIWISKILQPGAEMPGFPLEFVMRDEVGGGHVALASMGSQILALKEECISMYAGDPPNDLGVGGNLSGPHPVAQHTGCINPVSVVHCPAGVAFQSRDTIWLVNPGMQTERIGAAIEDQIATYPHCRAAVLDQKREVILWSMTNGENEYGDNPTAGITLVWHYNAGEWSVWHHPSRTSTAREPTLGSAVCWRGDLNRWETHHVQADGTVLYYDNGYHDHDGTDPSLHVSTPPLAFAGVAGFQRVRRLHIRGTYLGAHSIAVRLYYDNSASAGDVISFSEAEVEALRDGSEEHLRIHIPRQKTKMLRVRIETQAGASPASGAQARWETIAVEAAGKQGLFKLPSAGSK